MKYKQRKSESNIPQKIVEYLQGGILIRFNEKELQVTNFSGGDKQTVFRCDEFWFEISPIEEIEKVLNEKGFYLTEEHKKLIK